MTRAITWNTSHMTRVAALHLADQAQFDPTDVLAALRAELERLGGFVVEGVRVTGTSWGHRPTVTTTHGRVAASHVVLATGSPILDRGLYFAKLQAHRSYALAYRMPDAGAGLARGMYLSVDASTRSVRTAPHENEELLLVGGNGHPVGRHPRRQAPSRSSMRGRHWPSPEPNGSTRGPPRTTSRPIRCRSSGRCRARAARSSWRPGTTSGA